MTAPQIAARSDKRMSGSGDNDAAQGGSDQEVGRTSDIACVNLYTAPLVSVEFRGFCVLACFVSIFGTKLQSIRDVRAH